MSEGKNAFYAQSGGVTAVINVSACGVIETARKHPDRIGNVFAGRNGIIGALTEDLIDTSQESDVAIAALRHTPSGAFGSCRYKLKGLEENRAEYERLIEVFKAHNMGYFFYNGGGDSADTCHKISQLSEKMGFPIQAVYKSFCDRGNGPACRLDSCSRRSRSRCGKRHSHYHPFSGSRIRSGPFSCQG
jgi:6-phosphofructokinase 1